SAGTRTQWLPAPRRSDFSLDPAGAVAAIEQHRPDVLFVTSPNNPTGQSVPPDDLATVVKAAPGIVVVDEAYGEFSARPSAIGSPMRWATSARRWCLRTPTSSCSDASPTRRPLGGVTSTAVY